MFHWPLLSTVFGVVANFFFLSIVAVFSWFAYVLRSNDEFVSQSQKDRLSGKIFVGENETVTTCYVCRCILRVLICHIHA